MRQEVAVPKAAAGAAQPAPKKVAVPTDTYEGEEQSACFSTGGAFLHQVNVFLSLANPLVFADLHPSLVCWGWSILLTWPVPPPRFGEGEEVEAKTKPEKGNKRKPTASAEEHEPVKRPAKHTAAKAKAKTGQATYTIMICSVSISQFYTPPEGTVPSLIIEPQLSIC